MDKPQTIAGRTGIQAQATTAAETRPPFTLDLPLTVQSKAKSGRDQLELKRRPPTKAPLSQLPENPHHRQNSRRPQPPAKHTNTET
ncbi:hypothetical protein RHMOL_Rhmol06G0149000 [Rhododendron molle]|uniref:Uncharacterized protein n=1 Tax=Rhododendron molle TaxID=49168 RepID=A0ACC0ND88_RHOML|nr:hypothetical protein RHMOL_Rhmol06G0149000 [Rhododendron molle]